MAKLITMGSCFDAGAIYADLFDDVIELPIWKYEHQNPKGLGVIGKDDVVLLGGGEDITPAFYNVVRSRYSGGSETPSRRDSIEKWAFMRAQEVGAGVYGICRGAQMVCALSGGILVQHITGHQGNHLIMTNEGEQYLTSSVHHQMMWPFSLKDKFELIGWTAPQPRSNGYVFSDDDIREKVEVEPEIVWFKETKSLGIQGHPEFMSSNARFVLYSKQLVKRYFLTKES